MTHLPILYSFRRCPYAIRARMALQAGQRQVELREVVLKAKPLELIEVSVKATVPVLVLKNGIVLDESLDIMQWALSASHQMGIKLPTHWMNDELIERNDGEFKQYLDHYKYADRFPEANESDHRDRAVPYLQCLNLRLAQQRYLSGTAIGVLDIAIFPFIRQFAAVDRVWFDASELPFLQAWLNKLLESALFLSVMHKYKSWSTGNALSVFPVL